MKKYIIIIFILFNCISVYSATAPEVIDCPGLSKRQIYDKSILWIADYFRSSDTVTDYKDLGTGKIIIKCYLLSCGLQGVAGERIGVKMTIEIKDGKSRISVDPFEIRTRAGTTSTFTEILGYGKCFDKHMKDAKNNFKDFVNKKDEAW